MPTIHPLCSVFQIDYSFKVKRGLVVFRVRPTIGQLLFG